MRAGNHYNALTIDKVVDRIREPEQMCPADVFQDYRELFRIPLYLGQGRASGP